MSETIRQDVTVGDLVASHPRLRRALERLGIDYCCGGHRLLGDAVKDTGLPWSLVEVELTEALKTPSPDPEEERDWRQAPVAELCDYIERKHHTFMKEQLPRLERLLSTALRAHQKQHGSMLADLLGEYQSLREEIEAHLNKEEQILFPYIRAIDAFVHNSGPKPEIHCGTIRNPIRQMAAEHEEAGGALSRMRRITGDYSLPSDACQTFCALYDGLQALEADLHEHIHLENNILFPKAAELEQRSGICAATQT